MSSEYDNELIVTIVKRGWSEPVIAAARRAGAEGGDHPSRPRDRDP